MNEDGDPPPIITPLGASAGCLGVAVIIFVGLVLAWGMGLLR